MIPTIGLIIGVYVILRCLEMLAAAENRYSGNRARAVVVVASCLTVAFTSLMLANLLISGTSTSNALSELSSTIGGIVSDTSRPTRPSKHTAGVPYTPEEEKLKREVEELIRKTNEGRSAK